MRELLTDDQLEKSHWFLTHIATLKREGFLALVILDAIVLVSCLVFTGLYFFNRETSDSTISTLKASLGASPRAKLVQDLGIDARGAVNSSYPDSFDLYAHIVNPNAAWRAELKYHFEVAGEALSTERSYVYPGEGKYLVRTGVKGARPSSVELKIDDITWTRMTQQDTALLAEKYQFSVSEPVLRSDAEGKLSELTVEIENKSVYNFWEADLPMVVIRSGDVVALMRLPLSDLRSGEKRQLQATWYRDIGTGDGSYSITPQVNIFDSTVFRPYHR